MMANERKDIHGMQETDDFSVLAKSIRKIDSFFKEETAKAVNRNLTARNWLIGFYLFEYEQHGNDRAKYGTHLLKSLAEELNSPSMSAGNLKMYRRFYQEFPMLASPIKDYISERNDIDSILPAQIGQLLLGQFGSNENNCLGTTIHSIGQSAIGQLNEDTIFRRIPYTHLTMLFPIHDPLKRMFYELECVKGTWSAKELKRQIDTNYYERTALSASPEKMSAHIQQQAEHLTLSEVVKSPHVYEFLGLKERDVVEETDLEQAIMDHLQDYLLELGQGFCFEARQKRLLIDDEYFYCDLVFYHRVLKCHVIIELKSHKFSYADLAQLNMYVAYYRKNMMLPDDNPPVGILLCTEVGREQVEYATAGMDQQLFVSRYLLQLPPKKELTQWLNNKIKEFETNNTVKI